MLLQYRDNAPYQLWISYGMRMMPLSLGNIILLKEKGGIKESIPRQTDKKSRVPKEEKRVWGSWSGDRVPEISRRRKGQIICLHSLVLVNYTIWFKLCTRDYTTMYPTWGQFLLPENLTNPPDEKSWLIWKDPDSVKDWGQEEKGMTKDEMIRWHY